MKSESVKDKTEPLTKILFAVAVLLGALTFLKIGFFVNSSKATMVGDQGIAGRAGADDLKKLLAETKASAEEIKKKNLFVPVPAKQHPVSSVIGIMGNEALIGDKWYKVGDRVGEAKIVAIEPTKVRIAWDGQEKEFSPIEGGSGGGRSDQPGPPGSRGGGGRGGNMGGGGSRQGAGFSGRGLSSSEQEQMRERMKNASPEEKQRMREEMRQRFGSRGQ
jgi:hypothetical protein